MVEQKAKPNDESLIHNKSAHWVDRTSAMSRLAADKRLDLEPTVREWLFAEDPFFAGEAISLLLIYWSESREISHYLEIAMQRLRESDLPEIRASVAGALGSYMYRARRTDNKIMKALVKTLNSDEDMIVQFTCYEELLRRVAPSEAKKLSFDDFSRERSVDWVLIEQWR